MSVLNFIRKNAANAKTTVSIKESGSTVSLKLTGMPSTFTEDALGKLAKSQLGNVKGSVKTKLTDSKSSNTSFELTADKAAAAITGDTVERKPRQADAPPAPGSAATVGSNGTTN